jgi:hypothetical protein
MIGLCMELIAIFGFIWVAPWIPQLDAALAIPFSSKYIIMAMVTVVLIAGYSVSLRGLFSLHNISKWNISIEKRMKKIKNVMNYPIWQASAIWGLVITSLIIGTFSIVFPS